ncbi:unnamed protein product, partial [Ixodes pacificus]
ERAAPRPRIPREGSKVGKGRGRTPEEEGPLARERERPGKRSANLGQVQETGADTAAATQCGATATPPARSLSSADARAPNKSKEKKETCDRVALFRPGTDGALQNGRRNRRPCL